MLKLDLEKHYINACFNGDTDTISYMLKNEDLNFRNNKFLLRCLESACSGNHLDIFNMIIDYKNTVQTFCSYDLDKIIIRACNISDIHSYQHYLDLISETHRIYCSEILFNEACQTGNISLIMYIFKSSNDLISLITSSSLAWNVCLQSACRSGHLEIVNIITALENNDNKNWNSCLRYACECIGDNTELVKYVIDKGANSFNDCMRNACFAGNIKIVNLLIEYGVTDWNEGLMLACQSNHLNLVELMIQKGANDWDRGMCGACRGNNMNLVNYMIQKGANLWNICLTWANICGHVDIVKFLAVQGATNFDECLSCACLCGDIDFVKNLIEKGVTDWDAGLINACRGGHVEIVQLMLHYGATNLNESLRANETRNTDISKILIRNGANPSNYFYTSSIRDFKLLYLCFKHLDACNYMDLLPEYPPCVLFVGSRLSKNNCVKKLPVELFRLLHEY